MSSENTECFFEIDTSDGWEKSLTKILSSFEDPVFDINPTLGYAYVRGKTDRRQILKNLKKGGKHSELKRITFGSEADKDNHHSNNQHPYASLSKVGPLYDPYYYANNDVYNYRLDSNYNPWHNHHNNNLNHLFLNHNARNYYGANHHRALHAGHHRSFHRHDSSVPSSSTPSSTTSSSSSRPVTEKPSPRPPVTEPLRSVHSRRFGSIEREAFSIKKVTGRFRSWLRSCHQIK